MMQASSSVATSFSCHGSHVKFNTKSHFPQSRCKHVCCLHEDHIYMFSGKDGVQSLRDLWRYDLNTATWESLSYHGDKPSHLEGHTLVSYKKILLLFGGEYGDSMTEGTVWIINPDLEYVRKTSLDPGSERPCARRYHSTVVYNNQVFVYGGYVDLKGSSSELWCYHVDDEEWVQVLPQQQANSTPGGRHGHSAVVYNKCMWIYGGLSDLSTRQDFWRFRFGTRRWVRLKFKYGPPPLTGHTASLVNDRMLLFGGESNREPVNQLWCYSFKNDSWTQLYIQNQIPSPVTFHATVLITNQQWTDNSVKAKSVPYLQHKLKHMTLERPQSSPAYRSTNQETEQNTVSNQIARQGGLTNQCQYRNGGMNNQYEGQLNRSRTSHPPQVLNLNQNNCTSAESLHVVSSPQENTEDASPLIPSLTDWNYNAVDLQDKNVIANGIDNPGISKSTEELIRENNLQLYTKNNINSSTSVDKLDCVTEKFELHSSGRTLPPYLVRQQSEGIGTLISRGSSSLHQGGMYGHSNAKKKRLDSELVIEDLEDCDCFPQKVEVPFPSSKLIYREFTSSEFIHTNQTNNIDTTEFHDMSRRERSRSAGCERRPYVSSEPTEDREFRRLVQLSEDPGQREDIQMMEYQSQEVDHCDEEIETSFQCLPVSQKYRRESKYRENTGVRNSKHSNKQSSVPPSPYLLVIGGKEKNGVCFQVKPIVMWKISLKNH